MTGSGDPVPLTGRHTPINDYSAVVSWLAIVDLCVSLYKSNLYTVPAVVLKFRR